MVLVLLVLLSPLCLFVIKVHDLWCFCILLTTTFVELSGPLPATELLQMTDLQQLRVSRNQLSGPIPSELGSMPSLRLAHLHLNLFTGEVPLSVCAANVPEGLNFLQADCDPVEDPPNPCRCCSACCNREDQVCLRQQ